MGVAGLEVGLKWLGGLAIQRSAIQQFGDSANQQINKSTSQQIEHQEGHPQFFISFFQRAASQDDPYRGVACVHGVSNPAGPEILYPFQTVKIEALQDYIDEWQSPNFHELVVQPFIWMLLLTLGAVGASRKG